MQMRAHRYVGVTIVSAFVLAGLWPGSLLAQSTSADQSIGFAQRQVTRKPYDATAYHRLGDAYIQKARESGDVTYFDLAERALRKALELAPRYGDAARHLAFVLYSRHHFDGAAREAQRAVDLNPTDAHALGVLGDAYLEVGKYEAARETYGTMTRLRADLYSFSRRSGLRSLTGDPEGALEDLGWRSRTAGRAGGPGRAWPGPSGSSGAITSRSGSSPRRRRSTRGRSGRTRIITVRW